MANHSRLSAALAAWDRRTSNRAEDLASLGMELAEAAREVLATNKQAERALAWWDATRHAQFAAKSCLCTGHRLAEPLRAIVLLTKEVPGE